MERKTPRLGWAATAVLGLVLGVATGEARAVIDGVNGPEFNLTAKSDSISTADGNSLTIWGYANGAGRAQYPGPTLIVSAGEIVTVHLANQLDVPVSIVFPGQENVTTSGGLPGLLGQEALPGLPPGDPRGRVTYSFRASQPGTFLYHSGTSPELQVEMGLMGAIIVRPALGADHAYDHPDSRFDHEYLFLLSEMDATIHDAVEFGERSRIDNSAYHSVYWFINGRTAPDTMAMAFAPWLPTQPYDCMPRMHAGERVLMRVVNAGRELHPFHHHGNHARVIAKDARLLASDPNAPGPDLAYDVFTVQSVPGETVDAIYEWTGEGLGWDVYGHSSVTDPLATNEAAQDHGKPFPVILPENQDTAIGGHYSGSPFLGQFGALPPGTGTLNENGGFYHMWHSHTEKEMVNFDLFPGGMMTMLVIEPFSVPIP